MTTVLLVIHLLIAIALVITVLLQPSEGGGLGIGGGGGGGGGAGGLSGFLSGRGTANLLTRTTAVLAASFMATSVALTIFAGGAQQRSSILDEVPESSAPAEQQEPAQGAPEQQPQDGGQGGGESPEVPVQ